MSHFLMLKAEASALNIKKWDIGARPIPFRKSLAVPNKTRLDEDLQHSRIGDRPSHRASQLRATIQNHSNVFKPGLGTVNEITAKLEMNLMHVQSFARLVLYSMLFRKLLKLNTTVSSQKELLNEWNSVNGLPQWFMSPRQMETYVLVVIMPLLSTPSFASQYPTPLAEDVS